jgi:hypothetical protein
MLLHAGALHGYLQVAVQEMLRHGILKMYVYPAGPWPRFAAVRASIRTRAAEMEGATPDGRAPRSPLCELLNQTIAGR